MTGNRLDGGVRWRDFEVTNSSGRPILQPHGKAEYAEKLGVTNIRCR
jgi:hypothetical protein